jgi:hypothetical protein
MSRIRWHLFQDRQPRAHLVVGALVEVAESEHGDELAVAQHVLKRWVSKQKLAGDYAASVARDGGRPEVYFAFEDEADAQKFAAALEAEATAKYPGWASQRAFDLDGAKLRALEASLPLPKRRERRDPPDGSSLRLRVRRGPRTPVPRYDEE